ncbi:MAG: aminopeptidase PepB [Thiotrichales bacterium]|nr:MAG: aminopeptidase PepB [Thiotrichales bacterium]
MQGIAVYIKSREDAPALWGENNLISFDAESIYIYPDESCHLRQIQTAGRRCGKLNLPLLSLAGEGWDLESQFAFHQGFFSPTSKGELQFAELPEDQQNQFNDLTQVVDWVRNIVNTPAEQLGPRQLAQNVVEFFMQVSPQHVTSSICSGEDLWKQGFVGLHAVGKGSDRPPAMLILDFNPTDEETTPVAVALVGKGITFDSGGYSLKSSPGMLHMKADMAGAATVSAALALAILQGLKKRVRLILCCADNLVSGNAYKLGDILEYKNGTKVEITNTDAEGRLVLADGLLHANDSEAHLIIDAATLTGAAKVALGNEYSALFSNNKNLRDRVLEYASDENEYVWPLPLESWHKKSMPSAFADTANSAKGTVPYASVAAGFLSRFVDQNRHWVHFDMSNAYFASTSDRYEAGATGNNVRTIAKTILSETH